MKSFRPKDGSGEPPAPGRNGERDFHGERRTNETHTSVTDPEARLLRKGKGKEAKLAFLGHLLMENRHGLLLDGRVSEGSGTAKRDMAQAMIADLPGRHRITVGGGLADLVTVGRELTTLADGVPRRRARRRAARRSRSRSSAMGKLGGDELNYASDVDVLFVHDGDAREADRIARAVLATMSTPTADGIVFRTDADLRPEGRAGALSRTVDSYVAWYERWARHWEFQALIKARPVAGDADLGERVHGREPPVRVARRARRRRDPRGPRR